MLDSWKNDPLPSSKATIAQEWLLGAEKELAHIEAQIRLLESSRQALLMPLVKYRVALAPHKSLPEHVLREIFIWSAHVDTQDSKLEADLISVVDPDWDALPDIRLIISQVCSRWRLIALDTRELWSDVRLDFNHRVYSRLLDVLLAWIERCGQRPLSWDLRGYPSDDRIVELLMRFSHRLRSLSIDCLLPSTVSNLTPQSMGILETLCLGDRCHNYTFNHAMKAVFEESPRLRSVTVHIQGAYLQMWRLPWHQIRELNLLLPSRASEYYPILSLCTALSSARIEIAGIRPTDLGGPNISLPEIRNLYLASPSLGDAEQYLQGVSTPSLVDLTLQFDDFSDRCFPHALSFPALQRVHVIGRLRNIKSRLPWLHAWYSAVEVYLPNTPLDSVFDQIADGSLLPNITLLTLYKTEPSALIAMLEARLANHTCSTITHVALTHPFLELTEKEIESFGKLMESGVFLAHGRWARPDRTLIEARAQSDFAEGRGLFEVAE
ncbi:hypothetical protein B0H11DRAFT_2254225 [Mycena galericulata]|nr:hypothetical protein B0H11DRAFT_2254225 [Mycena galericulata]